MFNTNQLMFNTILTVLNINFLISHIIFCSNECPKIKPQKKIVVIRLLRFW